MKVESANFNEIISDKSFLSLLSNKEKKILPFIQDFSSLTTLQNQINLKSTKYSSANRLLLCEALSSQGNSSVLIDRLKRKNCFTITTGHQLNLLTGPLYSIYKIATVIKIAEEAKATCPEQDFLPVFWMATEDHDFEEIDHVHLFGKKINWETKQSGAVGRFEIEDFDSFKDEVLSMFREPSDFILSILDCYQSGTTLAESHRKLIELLFQNQELIIIDGDDVTLKKMFVPKMIQELDQVSFNAVSLSNKELIQSDLKVQAHVREINLFYLDKESRERIVIAEQGFSTTKNGKTWTREEIEKEMQQHPDRFSPNVLFRPIYQESILPNLMYVGGGGELAYWTQLKKSFEVFDMPMPLIQLRYSALMIKGKQWEKWESLGFKLNELFQSIDDLNKSFVARNSEEVSLENELNQFRLLMDSILEKSNLINNQLDRTVEAEKVRIIKQLESLEKRIQKNQKSTFDVQLGQIKKLKTQLFPNNSWQERVENVLPYLFLNETFVDELIPEIVPFENEFQFNII